VVQDIFVARTHDELLFFTSLGRVYSMTVFEVPEASRIAKGRAIINLLPLQEGEKVVKLMCVRDMENKFIVMLTRDGVIKRTDAMEFAKIRSTGIRAVTLREGDELVFCAISTGSNYIIIATADGQGIRFKEGEVRSMGRQAAGVMGVRLREGDYVVGMEVVTDTGDILVATENGYGKRVLVNEFRIAHRGGIGVRTIPTTSRNGKVIGLTMISERAHVLLIDKAGKIIRLPPGEIRTMGRQAQGVRLIRLDEGQKLSSVVAFEEDDSSTGGTTGVPVRMDPADGSSTPSMQFGGYEGEFSVPTTQDVSMEQEDVGYSAPSRDSDTEFFV
jgi:DNA gyrase subunit A